MDFWIVYLDLDILVHDTFHLYKREENLRYMDTQNQQDKINLHQIKYMLALLVNFINITGWFYVDINTYL